MKDYKNFSTEQLLLLKSVIQPASVSSLNLQQWSELIRMTNTCNLTAHLAWLIEQENLEDNLPEKVKAHFLAAKTLVAYRQRLALWEINRLHRALSPLKQTIVYLKGCAYLLAKLPFAKARLFSDVDILVAKQEISVVEQTLLNENWQSQNTDDYDQNYYRLWMHEIPPLRHILRAIEVDIHHTIIPPVGAFHPDPALLMGSAIEVDNSGYKVLAPCDMVLHSAVHLFSDSDLNNKLKDLVDLDQLLRHFFSQNKIFLNELIERAEILGLLRPLYYSLRYTQQLLETPVPESIIKLIETKDRLPIIVRLLMDTLVPLALLPEYPDQPSKKIAFARWLLYIRSHYLRMPMKLLLPHLVHKSVLRWQEFLDNLKRDS